MPFRAIVVAFILCGIAVARSQDAAAETHVVPVSASLAAEMAGRNVSFLALDLDTRARCVLADSDLDTRYGPWSTFKIPNLLIALETGVAESLDAARAWDQQTRPAAGYWPDAWRQDQTLESAFRRSAVWYFQDIAIDVGTDRYRSFMEDWEYGNATAPDHSDHFWLDRTLRISVTEQVAFLSGVLSGSIDVAPTSLAALTKVSEDGRADGLSLHGKSGAGTLVPGDFSRPFEGWYVGWVAREGSEPVPFALYAQAGTFAEIRDFRRRFAIQMLNACGHLPDGFDR